MNFTEYAACDGLALADLIARREVTVAEVTACAQAAIDERNPRLNAVLTHLDGQAYADDQPFSGIPFLIKELVLTAEGARSRGGSRSAPDAPAPADTTLMAAYRQAGLHLIGTTQTPEMGYNATTETVAFGPVHNPWKTGHSAGGSSGGSGAAVAAGLVPIAHANDGGGSIRIPASCNGIIGLKPSRDRTPTGPDSSDPLFAHAIEFVVSRSVRDAAALLDCVAGPDLGAPHLIAPPVESFLAAAKAPPRKLTIAYTEGSLLKGVDMHDENIQAARLAAERLGDLGHTLIPCPVEVDFDEFAQHINVIWCAFAAQFVQSITANVGCAADSDHFEAVTLTCAEFGRKVTSLEILDALAYVNQITRSTAQAFEEFDVLMSATVATPPPVHGTLDQNDASLSAIEWTRQTFEYANNTPLFNSTGQPAISLPLHWTTDNLPVGVQFAGRMGEEGTLLNLASQLEQACEWRSKQAALWT